MEILFEQLKHLNFDIEKIFAMNQRWKNDSIFTMSSPRPTNALVFFRGGNAEITSEEFDAPLKIEKGSLCFIPSGKTYTWKFYNTGDENNIVCMLFEFIPKAEDGSQITLADNIKVVDDTHSTLYTQKFFELVNEFSKPQMSYPQLKAVGFSIIACASQALCEKVIFRQNLSSIYSGIQFSKTIRHKIKVLTKSQKCVGSV